MTGQHRGLASPADLHLADQLAGWLTEYDETTTAMIAQLRASAGKSLEELTADLLERDEAKTRLLCKARLLIAEVVTR